MMNPFKAALQCLYKLFLFLGHRYGTLHFNPRHARNNFDLLIRAEVGAWLDSSMEGRLRVVRRRWSYVAKNILLFGAPGHRLTKVMNYTFMTLLLEIYNPFNREMLKWCVPRKIALAKRVMKKWEHLNGRLMNQEDIEVNLDLYERGSLMQQKSIQWMRSAVRRQGEPLIVREVKKGLKKGISPLLVTEGKSGSYWMRGPGRKVLGLFKPFDEEMGAPNNPLGPNYQGPLGKRGARPGIRVGEAAHREVAAFVVDQFLGFGIVPRTHYASFTHKNFFLASEDRVTAPPSPKTKWGSFQEYIEGFVPLVDLLRYGQDPGIPLVEFQLLAVLDVVIGNDDRHIANILVGEEKLAAIDHGLSFPDVPSSISTEYWGYVDEGKQPIYPAIVELLDHFPFEPLSKKLHKGCMIPWEALARSRERVALFAEGILAGLTLAELKDLFTPQHMFALLDLSQTLRSKAKDLVAKWVAEKSR